MDLFSRNDMTALLDRPAADGVSPVGVPGGGPAAAGKRR
jgi:hypothetical protein